MGNYLLILLERYLENSLTNLFIHIFLSLSLSLIVAQTEEDDFETDSLLSSQGDVGESFRQGARVVVSTPT